MAVPATWVLMKGSKTSKSEMCKACPTEEGLPKKARHADAAFKEVDDGGVEMDSETYMLRDEIPESLNNTWRRGYENTHIYEGKRIHMATGIATCSPHSR